MSARVCIAIIALATPIAASLALAESGPSSARKTVDFETAFAAGFPGGPDEHQVADWKLYAALVDDDVVAYAARVDDGLAGRLEAVRGKAYQTEQLETAIKQDKRLRAAFDDQRRRIRTMMLYSDGEGAAGGACRRSIVYVATEFRLVLGARASGADPLASATVAPGCAASSDAHVQITAGRSPRFRCWTGVDETTCGWRLPDMPDSLKKVIEDRYPGSIKLRWHWRGLGAVSRVRPVDSNGNRVRKGGERRDHAARARPGVRGRRRPRPVDGPSDGTGATAVNNQRGAYSWRGERGADWPGREPWSSIAAESSAITRGIAFRVASRPSIRRKRTSRRREARERKRRRMERPDGGRRRTDVSGTLFHGGAARARLRDHAD